MPWAQGPIPNAKGMGSCNLTLLPILAGPPIGPRAQGHAIMCPGASIIRIASFLFAALCRPGASIICITSFLFAPLYCPGAINILSFFIVYLKLCCPDASSICPASFFFRDPCCSRCEASLLLCHPYLFCNTSPPHCQLWCFTWNY
jgi:hypothetical protein